MRAGTRGLSARSRAAAVAVAVGVGLVALAATPSAAVAQSGGDGASVREPVLFSAKGNPVIQRGGEGRVRVFHDTALPGRVGLELKELAPGQRLVVTALVPHGSPRQKLTGQSDVVGIYCGTTDRRVTLLEATTWSGAIELGSGLPLVVGDTVLFPSEGGTVIGYLDRGVEGAVQDELARFRKEAVDAIRQQARALLEAEAKGWLPPLETRLEESVQRVVQRCVDDARAKLEAKLEGTEPRPGPTSATPGGGQ